jgi:predicted phosphodiesterase
MVKTLVIGDLHFDNKPYGLLDAQKKCVKDIIDLTTKVDHIIFLGDLMMHRKPYPRVLLALQEAIDYASSRAMVTIIRGNHDSENKSDDGVTALSLFEKNTCQDILPNPKNRRYQVRVVTQTYHDHRHKMAFIPHYEDEERIKKDLAEVPNGYTVFGHFGYCGSLNSAGDRDFSLSLSDFKHPTVLGHIHKHTRGELVTLLGTPYTTNFSEYKKESFYAIIEDGNLETFPIDFGPRHLVVDYDMVEENLDWINDDKYFTLLRINISTVDRNQDRITDLMDGLDVGYAEVKYKPVVDEKYEREEMTTIDPVTEINDNLIEEYINSSNTKLSKEELFKGLNLIHENQQSRNK